MHRIPMLALNVDRELVQQVSEKGWSGILPSDRQGVGDPVPATQAYLQVLYPAFRAHSTDQAKTDATDNPLDDPRFRKFVDGMLLWDRAMAEAIANPLLTKRTELVVGIVGRGHVEHRHGIPRQLESLGMGDVTVLLPWDVEEGCASPPTGIATAVFGLDARAMVSTGPRLGIELEEVSGQVKIRNVMDNSIAQKAGLLAGDVIVRLAGISVSSSGTVVSAVKRQAPGTWLPITIARNGGTHELIAKFPSKP